MKELFANKEANQAKHLAYNIPHLYFWHGVCGRLRVWLCNLPIHACIFAVLQKYTNICKSLFDGIQFCIKINSGTSRLIQRWNWCATRKYIILVLHSCSHRLYHEASHQWFTIWNRMEKHRKADLDFSRDRSSHSMQLMTSNLKNSAKKVELIISGKKTKI